VDGFYCDGVWGDGEDVWAWGYIDFFADEYRVLRRDGAAWVEEPVEGFEGCATAPEYCAIQTMYTDASGLPHAVGFTDADPFPPTVGTRTVWVRDADTASWVVDTEAVYPGIDLLESLGVVSGSVTLWCGGTQDDGPRVIEVDTDIVDLGYSASPTEGIDCLYRSGTGEILASTGFDVLRYDGADWNTEASTTCEGSLWGVCWYSGALDADGNVYLAGGRGGFGDTGPDQWRLHRWDGSALTEILEPCPEPNPYCGVSDLSVAGNRLYAVGRRDSQCLLFWAELL